MGFGIKHGAKNLTRFVAKPTVSGAYTFDNSKKTATITGYDAKAMTISGTREATSAGTYSVTFTLNRGYAWTDKTKTPLTLTWSIAKRVLAIPYLSNKSYTWAVNATFKPTVNNFDSAYATQSGTVSSTSAGSWTVTWALRFPNDTTWSDSTTANKTDSWSVAKLTLGIPSISGTKSFAFVGGTTRSISVSGFNSTYETQSGTTSTDAQGTYTITWALRYPANTQWSGGTVTNKTDSWSIVWVDGTSHYANDLYNRGWYKDGSIEWQSGSPTWGATAISYTYNNFRTTSNYATQTFHVVMRRESGSATVNILDINESSGTWQWTTAKAVTVGTSFAEYSTPHANQNNPRFGVRNSANIPLYIERIWIT